MKVNVGVSEGLLFGVLTWVDVDVCEGVTGVAVDDGITVGVNAFVAVGSLVFVGVFEGTTVDVRVLEGAAVGVDDGVNVWV